jgi:hypothetical protein
LITFTFRQESVKAIEFQAMPGPEARALRAKTIWLGAGKRLLKAKVG